MSNLLISLGHGKNKKGGYDPGAVGNGTSEAEWLRGQFLVSLKKYAAGKIDFYEQDMYANREASTISGYKDIIELHLDAAGASAKGGHIIIAKGFNPDALDKRLGETVKRNFGLRANTMFDNRNDLLNLNTFAKRGISYRLVELCFITNKANMDYFKANYDKVAKELVQDILNTTIASKPAQKEEATVTADKRSKKFKVGDKVRLTSGAKSWKGSSNFTISSFKSEYIVNWLNVDGTIYIKPVGADWGGNVYEHDIEYARSNDIQKDDIIKLRGPKATNWVGGAKITDDMRTPEYSVRYREGNVLYIDSGTFRGEIYDWDAVKVK
ncbi:N-acetylmuramoyl-L-alanine amidase [Carnobacterium antarcticum]|uniref:N-acetylmuramoyl-L-alanine amidase n=1 Tax=Carnobacterium antarcticum TaxID=2126436 RepID=A0ABW4NQ75_9LACT|nr:N-acetylmuramoyl-L-alanine amidase [Carnobacterium sp. CP1]ALV20775.1 Phage lysin, N-acetylmuramoyl-L-alanine amidase [Carnobacterium sp. CP1]